jgi:hypothetical protein
VKRTSIVLEGLFLAVVCFASAGAAGSEVSIGDEVRGETKQGKTIHGPVVALGDTTYDIKVRWHGVISSTRGPTVITVANSELKSLELLKERRSYTLPGMLIGAIAGVGIGSTRDVYVPIASVAGGVLGGVLGAAIGSNIHSETWVPVSLSVRRGPRGDAELVATGILRFAR